MMRPNRHERCCSRYCSLLAISPASERLGAMRAYHLMIMI